MKAPAASLSVWVADGLVVVKIAGRANFASSVDFKALVHKLRAEGHGRFVLDLGDCLLMDSTFLGVLAGLGLRFSEAEAGASPATIELLQPNERITDLLENLGVSHLFKVTHPNDVYSQPMCPVEATLGGADKSELVRTSRDAHLTLMQINPANIPKFKDVTQFLEEDLKKQGP